MNSQISRYFWGCHSNPLNKFEAKILSERSTFPQLIFAFSTVRSIKIPVSSTCFRTSWNRYSDDFSDYTSDWKFIQPVRKGIQVVGLHTACGYLRLVSFSVSNVLLRARWRMTGNPYCAFYTFIKPLRWKESRERLFKRFKGRRRRLTTSDGSTERTCNVRLINLN